MQFQNSQQRRRGFTLIEILVVVIIITVLASAVVLSLSGKPDEARVSRAKADIATIETALESFRLDMRRYPSEDEGLASLVKKPDTDDADRWKAPYLKRMPIDPWDNPYQYEIPGTHNEQGFDLYSYGADGEPGGEDLNMDIGNWNPEAE